MILTILIILFIVGATIIAEGWEHMENVGRTCAAAVTALAAAIALTLLISRKNAPQPPEPANDDGQGT